MEVGRAAEQALAMGNDILKQLARAYKQNKSPQLRLKQQPSSRISPESAERRVLALTNAARSRRFLPKLTLHKALTAAARAHTRDQAFVRRAISHVGSDGSKLSDRVSRQGYHFRFAGENVAHGQISAEHVFRSWMQSKGHRANILSSRPREMGLYVMKGADGRLFWTQLFGSRK